MRGHSLAAVEDLHRAVGQANFDSFANELVGNRVIVALDLDVRTVNFFKNDVLLAGFTDIKPGTYSAAVSMYFAGDTASFI